MSNSLYWLKQLNETVKDNLMSDKLYTLQEAMELLKISKPTVYAWSNKGILAYEETPQGRLFKISKELIEKQQKLNEVKPSKDETVKEEENIQFNTVNTSNELVLNILNQLNEKTAQLIMYAEEKGKVKLLTDDLLTGKELLKQYKQDCDFYQKEYFKLEYENKKLKEQINELQVKSEPIEKKITVDNWLKKLFNRDLF